MKLYQIAQATEQINPTEIKVGDEVLRIKLIEDGPETVYKELSGIVTRVGNSPTYPGIAIEGSDTYYSSKPEYGEWYMLKRAPRVPEQPVQLYAIVRKGTCAFIAIENIEVSKRWVRANTGPQPAAAFKALLYTWEEICNYNDGDLYLKVPAINPERATAWIRAEL